MIIWLINHYGVPPQYYPLARPTLFAKNLQRSGHKVIIFAASTVHNSDINLIKDKSLYRKETVDGVHYVYIHCSDYQGNGLKRAVNVLEFAVKLPEVCRHFQKPHAIVATSFDPVSCWQGLRIGAKYHARTIAEIADLWPQTMISYGWAGEKNLLVAWLRILEKKIYTRADAIVFTMEGAYEYIREQGWEKEVPEEKVFYINNGVDLEQFDADREQFKVEDEDLQNPNLFKVIYTGSVRKVNNLGLLLNAAKLIKNRNIRFLIWGDGDELEALRKRVEEEQIENVRFKGRVEKKYIPYITSHGDVSLAHGEQSSIMRYGLSLNKLFDYLAAGRPVIVDFASPYNPVVQCGGGVQIVEADEERIAAQIDKMSMLGREEIDAYGHRARQGAGRFDFKVLTERLREIIENGGRC